MCNSILIEHCKAWFQPPHWHYRYSLVCIYFSLAVSQVSNQWIYTVTFIPKTNCNTHIIDLSYLHYLLFSSSGQHLSWMLPAVYGITQHPVVEGCLLNGQVCKAGGYYFSNSTGNPQESHGKYVHLELADGAYLHVCKLGAISNIIMKWKWDTYIVQFL